MKHNEHRAKRAAGVAGAAIAIAPFVAGATVEDAGAKTFKVHNTHRLGNGSLQDAIDHANRRLGRDRVVLPSRLHGTIDIRREKGGGPSKTPLKITDATTIVGPKHGGPKLQGPPASTTLKAKDTPGPVIFRNLRLDSVGIYADGSDVRVSNSKLTGNAPHNARGVIESTDNEMTISRSVITGFVYGVTRGQRLDRRGQALDHCT